jgi:hypothetical protein
MPDGLLVTVPLPVPALVTVNVHPTEKVMVTVLLSPAAPLTVQVLLSEETELQPLQLSTNEPELGVAVSVTVPGLNEAEQVLPQLIPDGLLVTVPLPAPDFVTVSVNVAAANVTLTVRLLFIITVH